MPKIRTRWKTRTSRAVAGVALVAGLGVGALAVPASAAPDPFLTPEQQATLQAQVDAHRACLERQGVTLPAEPGEGARPRLTDEQRATMRAAHEACESTEPTRPVLTDEQKAALRAQVDQHRDCMSTELRAAGVTPPVRPADGPRAEAPTDGRRPHRPRLTTEQKAAFAQARTACADLEPNLGVARLGPMGERGPGGPMGGRGPGGPTAPASGSSPDAAV